MSKVRCIESITPRQADFLREVADGYSQAEIAERLVVTRNTVHKAISELESIIGCGSMAELGRWWRENRRDWAAWMASRAGEEL